MGFVYHPSGTNKGATWRITGSPRFIGLSSAFSCKASTIEGALVEGGRPVAIPRTDNGKFPFFAIIFKS